MFALWSFKKIIFLFVVMSCIIGLAFHKAIYGLLVLEALIYLRPQDDRPVFATLHIPLIITIVTFLCAWKEQKINFNYLRKIPTIKTYFWFILVSIISAYFALKPDAAWIQIEDFQFITFLFILIHSLLNEEKDYELFVIVMLICGIYFAYLLEFRGSNMLESISGQQFGRRNFARLNRNFGPPNYLAITMVIMFTFAFSRFLQVKNYLIKIGLLSICGVYIYSLIRTASRGGTLSLITSLMLFGIFYKKGIKVFITILIIGSVSIYVLPKYFPEYVDRFLTTFSYEEDASATDRLKLWEIGIEYIKKYPFLGIGPKNFEEITFNSPHNSYIQMASELGIPGFLIWLTLFFQGYNYARKAKEYFSYDITRFQKMYAFSMAIQISLVACAVQSLVTGMGHREFLFMLIAMGGAIYQSALKQVHVHDFPKQIEEGEKND